MLYESFLQDNTQIGRTCDWNIMRFSPALHRYLISGSHLPRKEISLPRIISIFAYDESAGLPAAVDPPWFPNDQSRKRRPTPQVQSVAKHADHGSQLTNDRKVSGRANFVRSTILMNKLGRSHRHAHRRSVGIAGHHLGED